MPTRILLLTQWFDPEPTFKGLVFAKELVKQGHEVEVLTGFPNYPGGDLYPGYQMRLFQREEIDGVKISRVPLYPSHDSGAFGRVLNYLSFAFSTLIYGLFKAERPNVIYAYHPPLTVGITAIFISFFRRAPIVYDIQDMWPDTLRATGMVSNERLITIVGVACNWVYKHVDQIVVLSPGFKRKLIERGVPSKKIKVIFNWCAEDVITKKIASDAPRDGKFRVLFAGNMGKAQALETVIGAAEILKAKEPKIIFQFLGGGLEVQKLKNLAADKELDNVFFLPQVPMHEVGDYLDRSDALLVHLKKDPLFAITIPSKTQAYMAAGKPIIMAVDGDAADLIIESQCGLVAEPENPSSIAAAILDLKNASSEERKVMAENGKQFYLKKLSLSIGVKNFSEIFRWICQR